MTIILRFLTGLTFCIVCATSFAQDNIYPIDLWLQKAAQKNPDTADIRAATDQAKEMWDKALNKSYQHLLSRLPKDKQEILRASQREWIKFRDADGQVLSKITAAQDGTIHQLVATEYQMQLTRARAIQLDSYDKSYNEN